MVCRLSASIATGVTKLRGIATVIRFAMLDIVPLTVGIRRVGCPLLEVYRSTPDVQVVVIGIRS